MLYRRLMRLRGLGKTGLDITELALGTWGLSGDAYGHVPEDEQDRVIDRAVALGIRVFETADVYGHGAMESKLGARLPKDKPLHVVTKIGTDRQSSPARKRFDRTFLRESFEKSRERLQRDAIDVLLLHNPTKATVEGGEATDFLKELASEGKVRAWGVSAGSTEVARAGIAQGAQVLSLAYNPLFASDLEALGSDIRDKGVGVIVRSVLAHGLLTGYWSMHKSFPVGDHRMERWTSDELRRRVHQATALRSLIGNTVHTMRAGAVRYALSNEDVSTVVLGPRSAVQLDQLVREAGKGPPYLDEENLKRMSTRLKNLGAI